MADLSKIGVEGFLLLKNIEDQMGCKAMRPHHQDQPRYVRPRRVNAGRPARDEPGAIDCVKAAHKYGGILISEHRAPRNYHLFRFNKY